MRIGREQHVAIHRQPHERGVDGVRHPGARKQHAGMLPQVGIDGRDAQAGNETGQASLAVAAAPDLSEDAPVGERRSSGKKFLLDEGDRVAVGQFDAASYDEHSSDPAANDLNSGTNFRRARLGVEGSFAKD